MVERRPSKVVLKLSKALLPLNSSPTRLKFCDGFSFIAVLVIARPVNAGTNAHAQHSIADAETSASVDPKRASDGDFRVAGADSTVWTMEIGLVSLDELLGRAGLAMGGLVGLLEFAHRISALSICCAAVTQQFQVFEEPVT